MKKILVLGISNYANRRLLYELKQKGAKSQILNPDRLLPFVNDKKTDRIYVQKAGEEKPRRIYKKSLSAIIPRIGSDLQFFSKLVEHIQNNIGIPSTATAQGLLDAQDKIRTIQLLSQKGIKTPRTFAVKKVENLEWIVEKLGGFPVVAKIIYGSQGKGIFILTEMLSAKTAIDAFISQGHSLLLQQYIETGEKNKTKHDYRAVVVDGKVVAAIKRNSVGKDFRTNASLKEDCEKAELSDAMKDIAIRAAAAVGLDCAGVDLAEETGTGEIYCYEVNGNFNFKSTEKFSGVNVAKYIAEYALKISAPITSQSDTKQVLAPAAHSAAKQEDGAPDFEIEETLVNYKTSPKSDDGLPFGDFSDDKDDDGAPLDDVENGAPEMWVTQRDKRGHLVAFRELSAKGNIPSYQRNQIYLDAYAIKTK